MVGIYGNGAQCICLGVRCTWQTWSVEWQWPVFLVSRRKDSWMISSTIVQHFVQVLQNLSNVSNDSEEGEWMSTGMRAEALIFSAHPSYCPLSFMFGSCGKDFLGKLHFDDSLSSSFSQKRSWWKGVWKVETSCGNSNFVTSPHCKAVLTQSGCEWSKHLKERFEETCPFNL